MKGPQRMRTDRQIGRRATPWRAATMATWCVTILAVMLQSGCGGPTTPSPGALSLSVGQWSGTTSQGMPIAFTVSADETLTTLTIGYNFNGCSGSQMFSNLNVRTAPEVICVPGPCSGTVASYRSFRYTAGPVDGGARTSVNGLFLPGDRAEGQAGFFDYPGCGTAAGVGWTATRR